MYETPAGSWRLSRLGRQRRARRARKPQLRSKPATDRRPAPRPWNNNKNKQNKTNKQESNAATNYLFFLFCQTPPMYKEVLSWLCALQGRRLLAHRRHFVMGQSLVSTIETFPAQLVKDSLEPHCALSPYVFNLICGIP